MRWFKHLSNAHDDECMAELMDEFGPAGYGIWWIILEKIAAQMDKSSRCSARYSVKKWSSFCGISPKKFQKTVEFLTKLGKLTAKACEKNKDFLIIECSNLLKFRDEYTKKSGQTPKKHRINSGGTPQQEAEAEAETDDPPTPRSGSVILDEPEKRGGGVADIPEFNPKTRQAFEDAKTVFRLSPTQLANLWGHCCPDEDRLAEAIQCAIEKQDRDKEPLDSPFGMILSIFKEGQVSLRTRKETAEPRHNGKTRDDVIGILTEAVKQSTQQKIEDWLKVKDRKIWEIVKSCTPFLVDHKQDDFGIILREYGV